MWYDDDAMWYGDDAIHNDMAMNQFGMAICYDDDVIWYRDDAMWYGDMLWRWCNV